MTKHTPLIRLQAAKARYDAATQACAHWDYENDGESDECCYEVQDASRELKLARKAVSKENK